MITFEKVLGLKNVSIFKNAPEMALADMASIGEEKTFTAGQVLISAETVNASFFVILSGRLRFYVDEEVVFELGPAQFFGETTVFSPASFPWRVVAETDGVLLKFEREALYQILSLHSSLGLSFLKELSSRLYLNEMKKE